MRINDWAKGRLDLPIQLLLLVPLPFSSITGSQLHQIVSVALVSVWIFVLVFVFILVYILSLKLYNWILHQRIFHQLSIFGLGYLGKSTIYNYTTKQQQAHFHISKLSEMRSWNWTQFCEFKLISLIFLGLVVSSGSEHISEEILQIVKQEHNI